jgi:hypothetical protein
LVRRPSGPGDWTPWWAAGAAVVAIAAGLLVTIIALGRRIVRQADEITESLDQIAHNTAPLFDIAGLNLALDRAVRALRAVREREEQRAQ